jgi:hypothetical protein
MCCVSSWAAEQGGKKRYKVQDDQAHGSTQSSLLEPCTYASCTLPLFFIGCRIMDEFG